MIRRVYLDLLGLPPTADEVDHFLNDSSPDAYQRVVEWALACPHYGERWGRHGLDQARYADTNGYTIDSERTVWPYRDWVIAALNRDMPFDQFTLPYELGPSRRSDGESGRASAGCLPGRGPSVGGPGHGFEAAGIAGSLP